MRFTIERIRTAIVVTTILLVLAIGLFLGFAKFRHRFIGRDIPERLGINIQQESNGVTYTQAHGGHTIFKIHASRVIQLRNSHTTLHDVIIEIYGKDGSRVDRIQGAEFELDQKTSIATAAGMVEIEIQRPSGPAPQPADQRKKSGPAIQSGPRDSIRVKTSGVTFNQNTGIVTTAQRLEFSTEQGSGSAVGASYDSDLGLLVLNSDVALNTVSVRESVAIRAMRAEFNRDTQFCTLFHASVQSRGEQAEASEARISFRQDGSVEHLHASSGFNITSHLGSHIAAPTGDLEFTPTNEPRHAHLEGGVTMESSSAGRNLRGTSPVMDLEFTAAGELRHAHLERGVDMQSQELNSGTQLVRTWHSPIAEIEFRNAAHGQIEPVSLHGTEGVIVTSEARRSGAAPLPSRLAADDLIAQFGPRAAITSISGAGHASIDQTAATGARHTATGNHLDAQFTPPPQPGAKQTQPPGAAQLAELQYAKLDGQVILVNQPPSKPGAAPLAPLRATAGRAEFQATDSSGKPDEWLHLSLSPRVVNGGIDLTADKLDIAQSSGDAYAHGNVKASWIAEKSSAEKTANGKSQEPVGFGGTAPAHVIASEAQLHQSSGEATFRGHARLWQDQNSISAPVIVLNRPQQTLTAQAAGPAEPVLAVLLTSEATAQSSATAIQRTPTVIRVRSGDLRYSAQERKAVLRSSPLLSVVAQTGAVQTSSDQIELYLTTAAPQLPGTSQHAVSPQGASQIDRIIAQGHVALTAQGRRGTGAQLVYTAKTGDYVLTGSSAAPPRMTDPQHGSVTGESLLFNSRDDSVSIEGGSQLTTTQTTVPR